MSTWIEITDPEDVELDPETDEFNILYSTDEFGNNYVTLPGSMIRELLKKQTNGDGRSSEGVQGPDDMAAGRGSSVDVYPVDDNLKNSKPCGNSSESWNFV